MVYIEVKNHGRNITYVILLASDNRGGIIMDNETKQFLLDMEKRMIERMEKGMNNRFDKVDEKLDNIQSQLNTLEQRIK